MKYERKGNSVLNTRYQKPIKNRLTQQMLQNLHKEMQEFRDADCPVKCDMKGWLLKRGVITEDGSVVVTGMKKGEYSSDGKLLVPTDCDPIAYEQCMLDYEQYQNWHTWMRKRHEIGFCFCAECCEKHDYKITPVVYRN